MNHLAPLLVAAVLAPATQSWAAAAAPQIDSTAELRQDQVYTVDPAGGADFVALVTAVATVPDGSLLILRAGVHTGVEVNAKSLRIESESPLGAKIIGPMVVANIRPGQEVYLSGLSFFDNFEVVSCAGEVGLFACSDQPTAQPDFEGSHFCVQACQQSGSPNDNLGCNQSRHRIESSTAVSLVDCELNGRDGFPTGYDGAPGENALEAIDSIVSVYGGSYIGGDGGEGNNANNHAYGGSGGDGVRGTGALTRLRTAGCVLIGGAFGDHGNFPGCDGFAVGFLDGAIHIAAPADSVSLLAPPVARPGTTIDFTVAAPVGATVVLKVGTQRTWRDFPGDAGTFHIASPFRTIPVGTVDASGVLTGSLPTPLPQWAQAFERLEIQAQAVFGGQYRFSEPRTLHVTSVL